MTTPTRHYGLLPTTPDHRDFTFQAPRRATRQFVDLSAGIFEVLDQLDLGSCVPHGVSEAVEFTLRKQNSTVFRPSRLFIYYNGRRIGKYPLNQDTGLQIRDGIMSAVTYGCPNETLWSYDIPKFTVEPPSSVYDEGLKHQALKFAPIAHDQLDDAITSGYPVVSGFDVKESFESDQVATTGIVPMPTATENLLGGHCTIYTSTPQLGREISKFAVPDLAYRKKLNSWGRGWGLDGFYWEPVPFADEYESDFWVITGMEDPAVTPPEPPSGDPSADFAAVLKPWIPRKHTSINQNNRVAAAAKVWIEQMGL